MKITFLGTGTSQGIPVIGCTHPVCLSDNPKDKRMRSSIMITTEDVQVVIDCGPDFRMQMLDNKVTRIDAILFTHEHADHIAGLDDVRQFSLRQGDMPIYAHKRVLKELERRFTYIFDENNNYKGKPKIAGTAIVNESFFIKNTKITPIDMLHGELQTFGFRIADFAYLTDVSFISKEEKQKLQNLKVMVIDTLRVEPHPTHFNLEESLALIDELKPKHAYFTHISHRLGFHDKVQESLPKNVSLGYDGLVLNL